VDDNPIAPLVKASFCDAAPIFCGPYYSEPVSPKRRGFLTVGGPDHFPPKGFDTGTLNYVTPKIEGDVEAPHFSVHPIDSFELTCNICLHPKLFIKISIILPSFSNFMNVDQPLRRIVDSN
jgi:hypothetical protein